MTPKQVFEHFGSKANAARELGITYQAVDKWEANGEVPEGRQALIQLKTDGVLIADSKPSQAA